MTAYRNESDALRAQLEQTRQELLVAEAEIERLRAVATPAASHHHSLLAGAPTRLVFEGELAGELSEQGHEEVLEVLRRSFGCLGLWFAAVYGLTRRGYRQKVAERSQALGAMLAELSAARGPTTSG